jgi:hypothetical protein
MSVPAKHALNFGRAVLNAAFTTLADVCRHTCTSTLPVGHNRDLIAPAPAPHVLNFLGLTKPCDSTSPLQELVGNSHIQHLRKR